MLEGGKSSDYLIVKKWLFGFPDSSHKLLAKITDAVIMYLNMQIASGVDVVMLFDTWGGVLTESAYLEFSLPYLNKILSALNKNNSGLVVPSIVFTKGGGIWLEYMSKINTNALGIDWTISIAHAYKLANNMALQGNFDPVILAIGDKAIIKKEATRILHEYSSANNGQITGHIFNLGHGVLPITNPDNVAYLVDIVHELSSKL
jgi:uroporphyrinogen decarboxylase